MLTGWRAPPAWRFVATTVHVCVWSFDARGRCRQKLRWCYRREGVNYLENCKQEAEAYFARISSPDFGMLRVRRAPLCWQLRGVGRARVAVALRSVFRLLVMLRRCRFVPEVPAVAWLTVVTLLCFCREPPSSRTAATREKSSDVWTFDC